LRDVRADLLGDGLESGDLASLESYLQDQEDQKKSLLEDVTLQIVQLQEKASSQQATLIKSGFQH
jgi:hypothetical protein